MMNKLINRLAQQAFKVAFTQTGVDSGVEFHAKYNEKFAELIVNECLSVVDMNDDETMSEGDMRAGMIRREIKQRFGVK